MKKKILLISGLCLSIILAASVPEFGKSVNPPITIHKNIAVVAPTSYPVTVYSAYGTQCQPGSDLGKAIDGDKTTLYHSSWSGTSLPDTLDFNFVEVSRIDTMIYYPRQIGTNGYFGNSEIWYSTASNPTTFSKLMDKDFGMIGTTTKVALKGADGILNPAVVRVIVKTGKNNFASCAEMEFRTTVKPVIVETCDPSSTVPLDIKQAVSSGYASNFQPDTEGEGDIKYSFDGDPTTIYHSNWDGGGFPITLDYNFTNIDKINYLVYRPRSDGGDNGLFQETEIWYSTTDAPTTFTKYCDYNFNASNSDTKINFSSPILSPATIRFIVKNGLNNYASCSEMEFYKAVDTGLEFPENIFHDTMCTSLKSGITQTDIDGMANGFNKSLAQCMFNGTYDTTFRVQNYEAYPVVTTTASALKTSGYSQFENPTGIYFEAGKAAIVLVENTFGQNISLKVSDYSTGANASYTLNTGLNKITISSKGLGYINYYTYNYKNAQPIRIHIVAGKINGYYDVKTTTPTQWKSLMKNAVTNMIDLKGKYIGMLFPVVQLRQYSPDDAKPLVQVYDTIVRIEHEQMGLYKYNKVPKNHMFAEADNEDWSWYAGGKGAHFSSNTEITCNAVNAHDDCWGLAHELGHVNQIRPGLKWAGTTEVTNNIHSTWINYLFTPNDTRLEKEVNNDAYYDKTETGTTNGKGNAIIGGRYNAFLNNGLLKKQIWMFQYGSDNVTNTGDWAATGGDFFLRLIPLWQLELYYQVVHPEKKDWYGDIAEKVRNTNETSFTEGKLQMNFMKNVCDATGEDLTDFFRNVGMLRTFNRNIDDYGIKNIVLSAADSAAVVTYIAGKNYPKPESPVMYYLSANNVNAFKNKLAVEGTVNVGCTPMLTSTEDYQKYIIVDHAVWKNVVVFETYSGNKLIRISMVGSGYTNNDKTRVYYPSNATAIYAVAWDGTRKLVYGIPSAVSTVKQQLINMYPNPVKDGFYIKEIGNGSKLTITNLNGQIILEKIVNSNDFVAVKSLTKGVYLVKVSNLQNTFTGKLIKE